MCAFERGCMATNEIGVLGQRPGKAGPGAADRATHCPVCGRLSLPGGTHRHREGAGACAGQKAPAADAVGVPDGCWGVSCDTQLKTVTLRFDNFEQALAFYSTIGPSRVLTNDKAPAADAAGLEEQRAMAVAQEAAYPYPGECHHTSVKMRHTDQSLAFRTGWKSAMQYRSEPARNPNAQE